jgi:hypothetical protein
MASGRTGRSINRLRVAEEADYGRELAKISRAIRQNDYKLRREDAKAGAQAKGYIDQQFAQVAFQPIADVAPPAPVMQSVGAAALMDGLKIASTAASIYTGGVNAGWITV